MLQYHGDDRCLDGLKAAGGGPDLEPAGVVAIECIVRWTPATGPEVKIEKQVQ